MKTPLAPRRRTSSRIARGAWALAAWIACSLAPPGAHAAEPNSTQAAEDLGDHAYAAYEAGRYAEAIALYVEAYDLSRSAAMLYNIATIYDRRLHERTIATEYFRRYLQSPDAKPEFVQKAAERLAELKREADDEEKTRAPLPTAPTAPPPPSGPVPQSAAPPPPPAAIAQAPTAPAAPAAAHESLLRPAAFVSCGVGAAGIAASLALGLVAKGRNDDASVFCGPSTCSNARGITLEHQAGDFGTAATAALVAGSVLVATGATILFVAPRSRAAASRLTVEPQVGARGGGLRIGGTF
jgi:tetratricopeptide (TPR) repeat protein